MNAFDHLTASPSVIDLHHVWLFDLAHLNDLFTRNEDVADAKTVAHTLD
jgi:hypothetical protein